MRGPTFARRSAHHTQTWRVAGQCTTYSHGWRSTCALLCTSTALCCGAGPKTARMLNSQHTQADRLCTLNTASQSAMKGPQHTPPSSKQTAARLTDCFKTPINAMALRMCPAAPIPTTTTTRRPLLLLPARISLGVLSSSPGRTTLQIPTLSCLRWRCMPGHTVRAAVALPVRLGARVIIIYYFAHFAHCSGCSCTTTHFQCISGRWRFST